MNALSEVLEKKYVAFFNIVWDPDPHSKFSLVGWIWIQIQDGENDHKNRIKLRNFMFYSAGQGSIFWWKTDIYPPPPSEIYIFSPKKQRDFRATLPTTK
jgi:hypothetical protein